MEVGIKVDISIAGPNPQCASYFSRVGERGKQALRGLQEGLRKFATPGYGNASLSTTPRSDYQRQLSVPSTTRHCGSPVTGVSLSLLLEVARHVPAGFTTREVVKHIVTPLAQPTRSSLADLPGLFPKKQLCPASIYAIHAWDDQFHELVMLLREPLLAMPDAAVFLDFLCANLFANATSTDRVRTAWSQVKGADTMVIALSSHMALTRTWLLYQLWAVIREHRTSCVRLLVAPGVDLKQMRKAVLSISLRHSHALQEDKDAIMADVLQRCTAAATFDSEVATLMLDLIENFENPHHPVPERPLHDRPRSTVSGALATCMLPPASYQQPQPPSNRRSIGSPSPRQMSPRVAPSSPPTSAFFTPAPPPLPPLSASAPLTKLPATVSPVAAAPPLPSAPPASPPRGSSPPSVSESPVVPSTPPPRPSASLIKQFHNKVKSASERLVGMIDQFDSDEKGYLNQADLEQFMDFYMDVADPSEIPVAATAVLGACCGSVSADNLLPALKSLVATHCGPSKQVSLSRRSTAASAAASAQPVFSKQVTMTRLASIASGKELDEEEEEEPETQESAPEQAAQPAFCKQATMTRLASVASGRDLEEAVPSSEALGLSASAITLLRLCNTKFRASSERIVGMIDQFDGDEKGYLVRQELEEFIDFYIENVTAEDVTAAAAVIEESCSGRITSEILLPAVKALVDKYKPAKPKPAAEAAPPAPAEAPAAAAPQPAFCKQATMTRLAGVATGVDLSNQEMLPGLMEHEEEARRSSSGSLTVSLGLLRRFESKLCANRDRLAGMVAQFDADDKGYLTTKELEEFIDFYIEGADPSDIPSLASALESVSGGQVSSDNMLDCIKKLAEDLARAKSESGPAPALTQKAASMHRLASVASGVLPDDMMANVLAAAAEESDVLPMSAQQLPPSAVQVMRKLKKVLNSAAERLLGMIDQFDSEEKGFLAQKDLEEFISFFLDGIELDDVPAVASAVLTESEGPLTAGNILAAVVAAESKQPRPSRSPKVSDASG